MAHDDEPLTPSEEQLIDEWIEQRLHERTLQPEDRQAAPAPQLIRELERLYQEEARVVDRRLERVWLRLEQRSTLPQSQRQPTPPVLSAFPQKRRYQIMRNPFSLFRSPQEWPTRLSTLAAAALLVVLVGSLAVGLILVRHGSTNTSGPPRPTATSAFPTSITDTPTEQPSTNDLTFSDIEMKTATEGWATAFQEFVATPQTEVLHTNDGGVHWKNVTPHLAGQIAQLSSASLRPYGDGASVRTDDFVDGEVAWELSLPNQLFKTTDGGQTWTPETLPGDSIRQFTFLDDQQGWVITEDGGVVVVFRTTDGGATWTKLQNSGVFPVLDRFWGVTFLNATTGFAVYINDTVGSTATLFMTQDGGVTWSHQHIAMPAGVDPPVFLNAPVFFNAQDGMMQVFFNGVAGYARSDTAVRPYSGGSPIGLYITQNGGTSWQGPIMLSGLEFPDFIDTQHGWALNGTGSKLLITSDSGRHWSTMQTSANFSEMSDLVFVSSQVGWALQYTSYGTQLLTTANSGRTWTTVTPQISN